MEQKFLQCYDVQIKVCQIHFCFDYFCRYQDFDLSKEICSSIEEENTCGLGNPIYTAPEQFNSKNYSYKVNPYSIGLIIHFIIIINLQKHFS